MNNLIKVAVLSSVLISSSVNETTHFQISIQLENIKKSVINLLDYTKNKTIEEFSGEGLERKKDKLDSISESVILSIEESGIKDILKKETIESYKEKIKKNQLLLIQKLVSNNGIKYNFCEGKNRSFYYDPLTNEQGIISFASYMVDRNGDIEVNDIYKENGGKTDLTHFDNRRKYITKQYGVAILNLIKNDCRPSNSNKLHERRKQLITEDKHSSNF